jgi:hypothetical protein
VWISLAAQILLYGAEINVVKQRRLWPRSLVEPTGSEQDRTVLADQAEEERAGQSERVDVRFDDAAHDEDAR